MICEKINISRMTEIQKIIIIIKCGGMRNYVLLIFMSLLKLF